MRPCTPQALARQLDAVGVVNEAIKDGVGVGWIADHLMPGRYGELRGDDRRSAPIALFEDFEQVVAGAGVERFEPEVVENEQIGATKGFDEARMTAVAARERQFFAELGPAMIDDGAIVGRPSGRWRRRANFFPRPTGRPGQSWFRPGHRS